MLRIRRWVGGFLILLILIILPACSTIKPSSDPSKIPPADTDTRLASDLDALGDLINILRDAPQPAVDPDAKLVQALAKRFRKSEEFIQRVVDAADRYAYPDYPKRENILAIISVESSFNPKAAHRGSLGLMQIHIKVHRKEFRGQSPYDVDRNIAVGVKILRGYYEDLNHRERSAVLAYNAGIGNFLKGRYVSDYHRKYMRELAYIQSITQ